MTFPKPVHDLAANSRYPLVFATISGAHLYGFASPDSDFDLRGAHVLPAPKVLGLDVSDETIELDGDRDGYEMDLVTHDIRKFMLLMLKKNGYVLEQLYSPLVIHTTPEHEELKQLGKGCITKWHGYHYLGFADTQWKLFAKESPRRAKPLLYVYRVLLTGLHLMKSGAIEANLLTLNAEHKLSYIDELIALKTSTKEKQTVESIDFAFQESEYNRLLAKLEEAMNTSSLPEGPSARAGLNDLLIRLRMKSITR